MKPDLSIIIPAYREENRLPSTMGKIQEFINQNKLRVEVIIVVEPSPDQTLKVAREWGEKIRDVKIIENPKRLGKGGAVRQGILQANGEVVAFMDADGATDLSFFTEGYLWIVSGKTKVVIGSRGLKESKILSMQPWHRRQMGIIFRWLTRNVMGLPYMDTQCGAKVFHRETIPYLFRPLQEYGFAFDVEVLLRAKLAQIPVCELPCTWKDKDGSSVNPINDGWIMLKTIFKLKTYYLFFRKEVPLFGSLQLHKFAE